jgi:ABC-type transport system involved in cytochrome c biogenesis permease subunit
VGVVVGVMWAGQARAVAPNDPNIQAMVLNDPKIFVAVVTWAVYSFAMLARRTMGWAGRRAAWLSAVGFACVLLNFLPINYFITTSHTFQ